MKRSDPRAIAASRIAAAKRSSNKKALRSSHRRERESVEKTLVQDCAAAERKRAGYRRRIDAKVAATIRYQERFGRPIASLRKRKKPKKPVFSGSVQIGGFLWTQELVEERIAWLRRESQKVVLIPLMPKHIISLPRSGCFWIRSIFRIMGYEERIRFSHDGFHYKDVEEYQPDKRQYGESLVALLVRDPRDALVSMWHFCKFRVRFDVFQDMSLWDYTEGRCGMMSRVVNFLNDWADSNNLHQDTVVHIVRYEDMKEDIVSAFTLLLKFFSYAFGSLEWASFITSDVVEKVYGLKPSMDHRARHCRRAEAGAWRDYYTTEQSAWLTNKLRELNPVYGYR